MIPADRLELLEEAVLRLRECAEQAVVVVEGARDLEALVWLGIGGEHYGIHRGHTVAQVIDDLAAKAKPIVILLDWDRTGGRFARALEAQLRGRTPVDVETRRRLSAVAHSRCLEDIPSELRALRRDAKRGFQAQL